jgi:hypothetical protein
MRGGEDGMNGEQEWYVHTRHATKTGANGFFAPAVVYSRSTSGPFSSRAVAEQASIAALAGGALYADISNRRDGAL